MGRALQVITGRVTNPGAALTAWTLATGDTLAIRSYEFAAGSQLLTAWGLNGTAGALRIRSPRMHDNVQGLRLLVPADDPAPLLNVGVGQRLYPQDVLTVEQSGSAAAVDMGALLIHYNDLPGVNARLHTWDEIAPRIEHLLSIEQNMTTGGTAGDYGGEQTIVADFNLLKANTDYAILGGFPSAELLEIGVRGPDTGNMRVAIPGTLERIDTRNWFVDLSNKFGLPLIPVFNAANSGATLVDVVDRDLATAVNVTLIVAQLSS